MKWLLEMGTPVTYPAKCGSAAAQCGKATPYREVIFNCGEAAPRPNTRRRSLEPYLSRTGKAEPYRTGRRQSRKERHGDREKGRRFCIANC
jgi:hypothetical protein